MTKDKVKEIIENIFEGEWKENNFSINIQKNKEKEIDNVSTLKLLLEQNYISCQEGQSVLGSNIILN